MPAAAVGQVLPFILPPSLFMAALSGFAGL